MKVFIAVFITILVGATSVLTLGYSSNSGSSDKELSYAELEKYYSEKKREMNEHMALMHNQMAEINATKDPEKRKELMREHEWAMYESMKIMEEMGDSGIRMFHINGDSAYQETLEERLNYMQQMMGQLMKHMAAMNAYIK